MESRSPMMNANQNNRFPGHWGNPPRMQTKDLRELPGGYGMGSGTMAHWIQEHLDEDAHAGARPAPELVPEGQPGVHSVFNAPRCGGVNPVAEVSAHETAIVSTIRAVVEAHVGAGPKHQWALCRVHRQVVAGTIYYFGVDVGANEAWHLKVLEALPHRGGGLTVLGLVPGKTLEEPLVPFDNNCNIDVHSAVVALQPQAQAATAALSEAEWGQLVGDNGEAAKAVIECADGVRQCVVVPEGSMVTMDWREDRVRVFVDANSNVVRAPCRG